MRISWLVLFPVSSVCRNRRFERDAVHIFARKAAGNRMKAHWLLLPRRPLRVPSLLELREQLELETSRMEELLAGMAEGTAGHFRISDPRIGSLNRAQLFVFHERHHFKIME